MPLSASALDKLFPVPSSPQSALIPIYWPGINLESTATLRELLKDNHERWHCFWNDMEFHNHTSHRLLGLWVLGADAAVMKGGYIKDTSYQRAAFKSPEVITPANFNDHLGKQRFYSSYLAFFTDAILEEGVAVVVEKYFFSKAANDSSHWRMFDFLLGGVIHPMIHLGHGLEFRLPGLVAEGLAQGCVHPRHLSAQIPTSFYEKIYKSSALEQAASRLKAVKISNDMKLSGSGLHTFSIMARIMKDPSLRTQGGLKEAEIYPTTIEKFGEKLEKLVEQWQVDTANPQEVQRKIEELSWMSVMIYGIGGWEKGKPFSADFFSTHLVTSSIFLPSYMTCLTPSSQELFLRSYFYVCLVWWIGRGRPFLNIEEFISSTKQYPSPAKSTKQPHESAIAPTAVPNPWLLMISNSLVHPDEHYPKAMRTLSHYDRLYGMREAGRADFTGTELKGAEKLDGSLFVRVAVLTYEMLGRVLEGEKDYVWDRTAFYE